MKDFDKIISKISSKDGLTDDESYFSFSYILEGNANEDQIEKFLLLLPLFLPQELTVKPQELS